MRALASDPMPTAVYRLYDAADVLLYIGLTEDLDARFAKHAAEKDWWPQVARKEIEWYDTRAEAEVAEDAAIQAERSVHNVMRSPWAPKPRSLQPSEMTVGEAKADLTEVVTRVRLTGEVVLLVDRTRARRRVAAIVPLETLQALDEAMELLAKWKAEREEPVTGAAKP